MKRLIIAVIITFAAAGCEMLSQSVPSSLLESSQISLTWKGDTQVEYTAGESQLGYNKRDNEYRVYNDRLSDWFIVRCSEKPVSEGQQLNAFVSWTGAKSDKVYNNLRFSVAKTDGNGFIHLWNESNRIGIIIKDII